MLALHTWTLDTTPLAEVLRVARRVGWDGIELRRVDFARAAEQGQSAADLLALGRMRRVMATAGHPRCGLLLDTYHPWRSGATVRDVEHVRGDEVVYVQFSDAPASVEPGKATDRLPPGRGVVPFKEFFARVETAGYRGFMSYEAPNPAAWARPADDVAREALEATRAVLPR